MLRYTIHSDLFDIHYLYMKLHINYEQCHLSQYFKSFKNQVYSINDLGTYVI